MGSAECQLARATKHRISRSVPYPASIWRIYRPREETSTSRPPDARAVGAVPLLPRRSCANRARSDPSALNAAILLIGRLICRPPAAPDAICRSRLRPHWRLLAFMQPALPTIDQQAQFVLAPRWAFWASKDRGAAGVESEGQTYRSAHKGSSQAGCAVVWKTSAQQIP
jgi:hypothetical protein